ncbi:putative bifunctional diguanylate cyclase/phosphodiesterase [Longimicrobium terrae]|uniref:Diguanylate cyclase (GGDEF)-like protein/PAS domain S-box-containing protein n=1 Tax=Longimicrobium terrae TaxID=1639882 RepID=A0A841GVK5_9BACT|nr:EAL domain-containing protein [Longimicrobium terrae]MBB4635384.1 diguanylate cyclase (GGDEF)-like protein/PAS domain S-box-containing protein [Longimicrobium terrae]MBB6069778.1 diguanylate cyclase (GGDEF)-like protein/PAS domain S-box-containing protein [Longimicrobium terrae]NNC31012.1 EAL domain-containing protein [Longimicrobium terrae]
MSGGAGRTGEHAGGAGLHGETYFRALIENASDVISVLEADGTVRYHSPAIQRLLGFAPERLVGTSAFAGAHLEDADAVRAAFDEVRRTPGAMRSITYRNRHATDGWRVMEVTATNLLHAPAVAGIVINSRDVTERANAENALRESEIRFRTVAESLGEGLLITDLNDVISYANPRMEQIYGYTPEELVGRAGMDVLIPPEDVQAFREGLARRAEGTAERYEMRSLRKDGTTGWVEVHGTPFLNAAGEVVGTLGAITDVTERRRVDEQLAHDALHDALTGLSNRALFLNRVEHELMRLRSGRGSPFAVLFLDVDRFKIVNDSLGHGTGDDLLREMGARLVRTLRPGDTVSRFGGDEFTVMLDGVGTVTEATHIADELLHALGLPFSIGGREVYASVSIGIALCESGDAVPEHLLRNADAALGRAKSQGKARYEVFDRRMHAAAVRRLQIETDLRRAVANGELRLAYQPVVRLDTGRIVGFEALVRWEHPEHGTILPGDFIPVAEETGQIVQIGRWVMDEACRVLAGWQLSAPRGDAPLTMAVNVSANQFLQTDIVDQVDQCLRKHGLPPGSVMLEITESLLIDKAEVVAETLRALRALGVQLHLDDFGTGYSSLAYLERFPIDVVKIDRSFVHGMQDEPRRARFVAGIAAFARSLGVGVVAEGVDSPAQPALLRDLGCQYAQGYLFARPLPAEDAERLLGADCIAGT